MLNNYNSNIFIKILLINSLVNNMISTIIFIFNFVIVFTIDNVIVILLKFLMTLTTIKMIYQK